MNFKRIIKISLLVIILLVLLFYGLTYLPHKIVNIAPSEVSSIHIFDGNTGKSISITNKNNIKHIIKNLNSIIFSKGQLAVWYMGYSFKVTIYKNDESVYKEFIINSKDTIRNGLFFLKDKSNSIDYDYIKRLLDDKPLTP